MNSKDICKLIQKDTEMMHLLKQAKALNLPNWMIGAGFVRNKVWDHLHGFERARLMTNDIDLVYFDPKNKNEETDRELSTQLSQSSPIPWEIRNQAYMHERHGHQPYRNTEEAISF